MAHLAYRFDRRDHNENRADQGAAAVVLRSAFEQLTGDTSAHAVDPSQGR
jgi:hypothetical protein